MNADCKESKYTHLPADNSGLFVTAVDLDADSSLTTSVLNTLPDACRFNGM